MDGLYRYDGYNFKIYRFPFYEAIQNKNLILVAKIRQRIIEIKKQFNPDLIHLHNCQGISAYFQLSTDKVDCCPMLVTTHGINALEFGENTISRAIFSNTT